MKTPKKKQMTEADLIEARDRLLELSALQTTAREEELAIREYLAAELYPADKEEGAATVTLGAVKLSITKKFNRRISKEDAELLKQKHPKLYAEVLNWTPLIRDGVYKQNAKVMDTFIVTTAAPSSIAFK